MYVPFDALPGDARIWIYQADKKFSSANIQIISDALSSFTNQWQVHGQAMEASYVLMHDYFIVLAANDRASGCSIDSSVRVVKNIGDVTGINFFERNRIAFKNENTIFFISSNELKRAHEEGKWNEKTLVFNNLVETKSAFDSQWLIPAASSWIKRYLPKESISH